jgi:hypothetical protein
MCTMAAYNSRIVLLGDLQRLDDYDGFLSSDYLVCHEGLAVFHINDF